MVAALKNGIIFVLRFVGVMRDQLASDSLGFACSSLFALKTFSSAP